ncbi:hypothetical protein [Roseibaca sp. Y0-43]|uniref:hypothetical protein n=1 Tax=Roseibaca sp. Y0-43 TaxID=2816854 RepID=UPI001D0C0AF1|nr:hypothetical protein [Roseibaca sp. Y0-43]MCC1480673.1 hypothetical protein [Roseibaca sp. Y0-43]
MTESVILASALSGLCLAVFVAVWTGVEPLRSDLQNSLTDADVVALGELGAGQAE